MSFHYCRAKLSRIFWSHGLALAAYFVAAVTLAGCTRPPTANPNDPQLVALGKSVYGTQCAACHGIKLEGQPNWQSRRADKRLPAPPHDASGHTWHHDDATLFHITKFGLEKYGGPGYQTDMPKFAGVISDEEIYAVLAYIKSTWPTDEATHQASLNSAKP